MIIDFVPEVTEENALIFDIKSKPKNLKNFWAIITKIDRHPLISQAIAIYVNQDFPSGTIIVSKYFYHKYPDFYVVYDKENNAMRVYTSPAYRGNKSWEYFALLFKNFFYLNLGEHTNLSQDKSAVGEEMYLKIKKTILEKGENLESFFNSVTNVRDDFSEKDVPRDPCFPYIWYNQRIGGLNG